MEAREKYQIKISNRFVAFEDLDYVEISTGLSKILEYKNLG